MSIYNYLKESLDLLEEKYIINEKDIYYNKDKFDSKEINLCFITGHSGSGKSTMAHKKEEESDIEAYELDDLACIKDHFTMDNLKEYGDLIYSFFNGPGKKYYVTYKDLVDNKIPGSEYEDKLYPDFVHYAMKYASAHKNKRFILEGVWLFCTGEDGKNYFKPEEFKDYAFYIKGTSMLISKIRGAKRDAKNDSKNKREEIKAFSNNFFKKNWKWYMIDEKRINIFRDYFKKKIKSINESSVIDNYRFLDIKKDRSEVLKYLKKSNISYAEDIIENYIGEIVVDKDKMIGRIFVGDKKDKGFIVDLEVNKAYRGQKLGNRLIDDAIKKYNGIDLLVDKDNEIALSMYKKRGFVIIKEYNNQYYMKLKK